MESHFFGVPDIIIIANAAVILTIAFIVERIISFKNEEQIKQHTNKPDALNELLQLFGSKVNAIRREYPSLTDTDAQVLILIGLGVDNNEILSFTDMSKRTYYKRRQLIAQRMNTTAAQLDELAKSLFTSK